MKNEGMSLGVVLSLEMKAGTYNGNDSWEEFWVTLCFLYSRVVISPQWPPLSYNAPYNAAATIRF